MLWCISTHFGRGGLQVGSYAGGLSYKIHNYVTKLGNQVPNCMFNANLTLVRNFEAEMGQIACSLDRLFQDLSKNFQLIISQVRGFFNQNILQMHPRALSVNIHNLRMSFISGGLSLQ